MKIHLNSSTHEQINQLDSREDAKARRGGGKEGATTDGHEMAPDMVSGGAACSVVAGGGVLFWIDRRSSTLRFYIGLIVGYITARYHAVIIIV